MTTQTLLFISSSIVNIAGVAIHLPLTVNWIVWKWMNYYCYTAIMFGLYVFSKRVHCQSTRGKLIDCPIEPKVGPFRWSLDWPLDTCATTSHGYPRILGEGVKTIGKGTSRSCSFRVWAWSFHFVVVLAEVWCFPMEWLHTFVCLPCSK